MTWTIVKVMRQKGLMFIMFEEEEIAFDCWLALVISKGWRKWKMFRAKSEGREVDIDN
jgi:hypothetical protein